MDGFLIINSLANKSEISAVLVRARSVQEGGAREHVL